jgi:hypothetical protein
MPNMNIPDDLGRRWGRCRTIGRAVGLTSSSLTPHTEYAKENTPVRTCGRQKVAYSKTTWLCSFNPFTLFNRWWSGSKEWGRDCLQVFKGRQGMTDIMHYGSEYDEWRHGHANLVRQLEGRRRTCGNRRVTFFGCIPAHIRSPLYFKFKSDIWPSPAVPRVSATDSI